MGVDEYEKIIDLIPEGKGYNMILKVIRNEILIEKQNMKNEEERNIQILGKNGENDAKIVKLGDDTGCIYFKCMGDYNLHPGTNIIVNNCNVSMYKNSFMFLELSRWGSIQLYTKPIDFDHVQVHNNVSLISHELVLEEDCFHS